MFYQVIAVFPCFVMYFADRAHDGFDGRLQAPLPPGDVSTSRRSHHLTRSVFWWAQVGAKAAITVGEDRLNAFLGKAVSDLAASVSAVLVSIGDELGLYGLSQRAARRAARRANRHQ